MRWTARDPLRAVARAHTGKQDRDISATPIATNLHADPVAIDGGGRTLMPGLVGDAPMNRTFRSWCVLRLSEAGPNFAAFSSGLGDGSYGSWWGLIDDRVVTLLTDFGAFYEEA